MPRRFSFTSTVWEHSGAGSWHFVDLPETIADDIEAEFGHAAKGFGSIRVHVTIGSSQWSTSLFPDSKRLTYVLPVKKAVRIAQDLNAGSAAAIVIEVAV